MRFPNGNAAGTLDHLIYGSNWTNAVGAYPAFCESGVADMSFQQGVGSTIVMASPDGYSYCHAVCDQTSWLVRSIPITTITSLGECHYADDIPDRNCMAGGLTTTDACYDYHWWSTGTYTYYDTPWTPAVNDGNVPAGRWVYDLDGIEQENSAHSLQVEPIIVTTTTLPQGDPSLQHDPVTTDRMYWTSNERLLPVWNEVDPALAVPANMRPLVNLQISVDTYPVLKKIYGVAMGNEGEFETFVGDLPIHPNGEGIQNWQRVDPEQNPPFPVNTVPYDVKAIRCNVNGAEALVLATATNHGVFISGDQGAHWQSANAAVNGGDAIRALDVHKIVSDRNGWLHDKIAVMGWDASYVGQITFADLTHPSITWHEITYTPSLFQHWDHAWSGLSHASFGPYTDVALINHAADPIYPDDKSLIIQVKSSTGIAHTISLGTQEEGTKPFMRPEGGAGAPWIVYNPIGETGPTVKTLIEPDYMTWDSVTLFTESGNTRANVYDVASSPSGNYISFDGRTTDGQPRLWLDDQGWHPASCVGLPTQASWGYIAPANNQLYYLCDASAFVSSIWMSGDRGQNFTLINGNTYPDFGVHYRSVSVGQYDGMPAYIGGDIQSNHHGRLLRYDPNTGSWTAGEVANNGIVKVVADPLVSQVCWVATDSANSPAALFMVTYGGTMPPYSFHAQTWWEASDYSHASEYGIVDVQIEATDLQHRVLTMTLRTPDSNDDNVDHTVIKRWEFNVADALHPLPTTVSGDWIVVGDVTLPIGATVTVSAGAHLMFAPDAKLTVKGTLLAAGASGQEITFSRVGDDQTSPWNGIDVRGTANLSYCTITGASVGLSTTAATALLADHCTIQNNGQGIHIYSPAGSGAPTISNCEISVNSAEGISMMSTPLATISTCQIHDNFDDGILLTSSSPKISRCHVYANADFGLNGYASSPTLYCNTFEDDKSGEMLLANGSYPVLWNTNGVDGGSNSFTATDLTLITMEDSYPVCAGGANQFTIYGTKGFFMEDVSKSAPKHDVHGNSWYPTPPTAGAFWPSDLTLWSYSPTASFGGCEAPKSLSTNAAQTSFEQGYAAEMAGNTADASTAYTQTISQYPDSSWAQVAASRLLNNQMQVNSGYSDLLTYYGTVVTTHASDTCLVETAQDLATRALVEDHQYASAMNIYQQIMANPPSDVDSACAALDYAITVLRLQYDSLRSGLDSEAPVVSAQTIQSLRRAVERVIPAAPEAHHENYLKAPETCILEQNYPNPFNATTTIRYAVPASGQVRLTLYNVMGQQVATLVDAPQAAGYHSISWNGTCMASGVYIYRLEAASHTVTQKMLLLK
ncbi:MAG TPA: right-handed parallel beta-helix repeat-containing protein [bacterium]